MRCETKTGADSISIEGNCPVYLAPQGEHYDPRHLFYPGEEAEKGVAYTACLKAVNHGGSIGIDHGKISVSDADEIVFYFAVRTSFNGPERNPVLEGREYREPCHRDLANAGLLGYENLKRRHVEDYVALYGRVSLSLGGGGEGLLPTDRRLYRREKGERDNALYALLFNFGRYLILAPIW